MKAIPYRQRVGLLALLCGCGLFLLVCRLAAMQVFDHAEWAELADQLRSGWAPVRPLRGDIVDSKSRVLAHDAAGFELAVLPRMWRAKRYECDQCGAEYFASREKCRRCRDRNANIVPADRRDLTKLADMLETKKRDLIEHIEKAVKRVEEFVEGELAGLTGRKRALQHRELWYDHGRRPVRIQRDVSYEVAREVALHADRTQGLVIRTSHGRVYPGGAAFAHILGRLKEPRAIEVARADGSKRKLSTEVGSSGLEFHFERELHGTPGWVQLERNPVLRSRRVLEERPAVPGARIRLTIDAEVQERAASALGNDAFMEGGFVVVNADTGAVLALVTAPRYEPEEYVATWKRWKRRAERLKPSKPVGSPLVERSFRSFQIPGSIMKPFTALAALGSGDGTFDERITCEREFRYHGIRAMGMLRCNKVHDSVDMHGALKQSCNIYFQTLVARMLDEGRFPAFVSMGKRFGFGRPTGIEIQNRSRKQYGRWDFRDARQKGTLIAASIGQGWVEASPAQLARAYAGLATGYLPRLHIVQSVGGAPARVEREPLHLPREHIEQVRAALRDVPRPGGSAHDYASELARYGIACKTGTAQRGIRNVHNAWMAGFAPARAGRPAIAFAMAVLRTDFSGGAACGPRLVEFFQYFYRGGKQ